MATTHTITPVLKEQLVANFRACVQGYHMVNSGPVKESTWEDINAQIFEASGIPVTSQSSGSHAPGSDISCALGGVSNKSAKYNIGSESFSVSSYRLTTACSAGNVGTVSDIISAIDENKNFQWYSVIVRSEGENMFHYDWYMIPSDHVAVTPAAYEWVPTTGMRGKNKGEQVGWHTNKVNGSDMSIRFSMSSQLWMTVEANEDIRQYIIGSVDVSSIKKFNYIQLFTGVPSLSV